MTVGPISPVGRLWCLVHKEGLLHLLFTLAWIEIRERQANE
jgi:hypothetical protein